MGPPMRGSPAATTATATITWRQGAAPGQRVAHVWFVAVPPAQQVVGFFRSSSQKFQAPPLPTAGVLR